MRVPVALIAPLIGAGITVACSSHMSRPPAQAPAPTTAATPTSAAAAPMQRTNVFIGESFSPRTGDAAIRAFMPEIAPVDSGGECMVSRTGGSGATIVSAAFPKRATAHTQATIMFDSAGHLIRYSERRGGAKMPSTVGMTDAQRDSALRTATMTVRSTSVTLDYAIDQAVVANRGGGRPTDAILGTVRAIENLEKLGPLTARIERVRRLCGV
jgi:hypothetical protein